MRGMDPGEFHLAVCRRFGAAVRSADGKWDRPSPCADWNALDVLEHVIGFHDVLLLRPLGCKPERPRDDPLRRWELTVDGLQRAFGRAGLFDGDAGELMPKLTRDVLVHTWDLARAVQADDRLEPQWCALFLRDLPSDPFALSATGMFGSQVPVADAADAQTRLLARLGRDPGWRPT